MGAAIAASDDSDWVSEHDPLLMRPRLVRDHSSTPTQHRRCRTMIPPRQSPASRGRTRGKRQIASTSATKPAAASVFSPKRSTSRPSASLLMMPRNPTNPNR